jgi:hypothetical protein
MLADLPATVGVGVRIRAFASARLNGGIWVAHDMETARIPQFFVFIPLILSLSKDSE